MKSIYKILLVTLSLCLLPTQAAAKYGQPQKQGTHFIAEIHGGASWNVNYDDLSPQMTWATTIGFGGKLQSLRIYLIGRLAWSYSKGSGATYPELKRNSLEYSGGIRLLLPLISRLRIYADLTLGGTTQFSTLNLGQNKYLVKSSETFGTAFIGGGVQFRLIESLSIGLHSDVGIPLVEYHADPFMTIIRTNPMDYATRVSFLGTVTFHF